MIPSHRAAAKLMKTLKRGEYIALLIDQYVARHQSGGPATNNCDVMFAKHDGS